MDRVAFIFLLLVPAVAAADLYTVKGKDGEITITSNPGRGAKILHRVRDSGGGGSTRASRPGRTARRNRPISGDVRARAQRFAAFVTKAAAHYKLPEPLVWAVMKTESNFYPHVVSNKGAEGLMQMLPGTANDMGVSDSFDPEQNIWGGARYLRLLANRFDGDMVLTLSAYHAGGGAVNSAGGIPYSQTAEYVRRVLNHYYRYQRDPPARTDP